jgi:hypothetical protein
MMAHSIQKKLFWQRKALMALAWMVTGALLLSACSNLPIGGSNSASSSSSTTASPTPAISSTLQNEGAAQLQAFQQWISLMQQNGGNVETYQQQYAADQQALASATTSASYTKALNTLQGHVQAIKIPALKQECQNLQQQLEQAVSSWGNQHTFHDSYNNQTYKQGYEYDNKTGIGGPLWLQQELNSDQTLGDYQQTVEDLNMWIYNFQQMQIDFNDKTPYNKPHQSDLNLLQHYGYMNERVVVVSLSEQALRAYDNGKLVKAFQVTTGQPDLPSPPGTWWIEGKKHPTVFKSTAPKGSPEWYPDTPINYAMQYHSNGYFLHDAWWRTQFGPGTNFPHQDPDGDPFAGQGSHGCVNMSTSDAAWLYGFVSVFTRLIIY